MGLVELISRLEREAEARLTAMRAQAQAKTAELQAAAAQAHRDALEAALAQARGTRQLAHAVELASAHRRARAAVLGARWQLLERVFIRARALVPEVAATPAYAEALKAHLRQALTYTEGLEVTVRCSPGHVEAARRAVGERARVVEDDGLVAGVVVSSADGALTIDETLAGRLERVRPRLAAELIAEAER